MKVVLPPQKWHLSWSTITKILQSGWLKEQTFLLHDSGGWKVQDQGAGRLIVSLRAVFLVHKRLSSHCVFTG